jgi:Leucine-rich repeat (LRR) protein
MHDLVHDLARLIMDDEILVVGEGDNTERSFCHYALINDCSNPLSSELSKIRALHFTECGEIELHGAAFSSAKSLRVLDLSECSIHKLPDSIGVLKQLRYLNAPRVQDAIIPNSITKLSKLIYLNLHGSSRILCLPESIGEIEGLAYLDLSGCSRIEKMPESFGELKELVHLDLSNCSGVGGISVFLGSLTQLKYLNLSYCPNIGELPEALGSLSKLQYLNLSFSSYLESCQEAEVLGALTNLEYLNLSSERCDLLKLPESLGRFVQLKYLNLSGCCAMTGLPRLFGSLKNLVHLDLSKCYKVDCLDEALAGITSLQYLNLKYNTCLRSLPGDLTKLRYLNLSNLCGPLVDTLGSLISHTISNFIDLEHLDLSGNDFIVFPHGSLGNLRKLHTLDLSHCTFLNKVPESIRTSDSLKFLYLNGCPFLSELPQLGSNAISLPDFPVHSADESSSNLDMLQAIDPVELWITKLENVKTAGEAHHIKLTGKQKLEKLSLKWTRGAKRFVDDKKLLEKLVPPSTLKKLEICGYNAVSFPDWVLGQLPNLRSLVLRNMANLEEWNTSLATGEEHVIQDLEIHDCPMLRMKPLPPRATTWKISDSDNVLSSWEDCTVSHTNASSSYSPITTTLSVKYSKVPLHQWRLLQHFPGLVCLTIENCRDLTGSEMISEHLYFLEILCLRYNDLEELPKWMGELASLQNLTIIACTKLKGLNENMRQLTKLQSLKLYDCESIASLPHWLSKLTSLRELTMFGCCVLRSLPESPELKHVVESEGEMKLTHNQERLCVLAISLVELHIFRCEGFKSLLEGIQQLTNLQTLKITMCPELKKWCKLEENQMKLAHIEHKVCVLPCTVGCCINLVLHFFEMGKPQPLHQKDAYAFFY